MKKYNLDNNLKCGWFKTNGINNDKIIYRITKSI